MGGGENTREPFNVEAMQTVDTEMNHAVSNTCKFRNFNISESAYKWSVVELRPIPVYSVPLTFKFELFFGH